MKKRLGYIVPALATLMVSTAVQAATITLVSDENTLGVATTASVAQAGDTSGLVFSPVAVGAFGTFTGIPAGSPAGTKVINIAPGDGENGFFRVSFSLPTGSSNFAIDGAASIDDATVVYLNGHALTNALHDVVFTSIDPTFFNIGTNYLDLSDLNTGGGPSGGGFYAKVSYDVSSAAVPEPASWAMMIGGFGLVGATTRRRAKPAPALA